MVCAYRVSVLDMARTHTASQTAACVVYCMVALYRCRCRAHVGTRLVSVVMEYAVMNWEPRHTHAVLQLAIGVSMMFAGALLFWGTF
jgi:hypothetical protein